MMEGQNEVSDYKQRSWTLFISVDACTPSGYKGIMNMEILSSKILWKTRTLKLSMQWVKLFVIHSELARMVAPYVKHVTITYQ